MSNRSAIATKGRRAASLAVLLLGASLSGAIHDGRQVINAGRGGDTTQDLLARLEDEVLAREPDLVVLLAGTNDRLNSKKALPLAKYAENLKELVRTITARGTKLLLVTVPPVHEPYLVGRHGAAFYAEEGPGARIVAVNAVIHRVAREHRVPVVEYFAAVENAGGASEECGSLIRNVANSGSPDGVHPTDAGYRLLGNMVAEVIGRENLQGMGRIVCFGDSITRGVHVAGEGTATGDTFPAVLFRKLEHRFPRTGRPRAAAAVPSQNP
jgi:lysophospholipase L1-like esterase